MENIANDSPLAGRDLTVGSEYCLTVKDVLTLPSLSGARVLGGRAGVSKEVHWVNVMEVPDVLAEVKPNELLLTSGFPLRHGAAGDYDPDALSELVEGLAERSVSALAVKAGRYLDELTPEMLEKADRLAFPVVVVPREAAFDEVISEVFTQLVDRQAHALDVADRLHRTLTSLVLEGGDVSHIAEEVAALFDTAVLICSPDGRIQAQAGSAHEESALEALPLFDPSGRFRTELLRPGIQDVPEGHAGQIAVAPVVAGDTDHGLIIAVSSAGGLGPVVVQALERAATVAALAITKQLAVAAVESKFRGDFVRDALTGLAGTPTQVIEHFAQLEWDVDRPLAVVVAQLDDPLEAETVPGHAPLDQLTLAWQQVVRLRDRTAPVVGFSHEVVALLPATRDTVERVVAEVVAAVVGDPGGSRRSFSAGASRVIDSVADLPAAYEQAGTAVRVGRRVHGPGSVAHFDSLGVHRVLSLVPDTAELKSFTAQVLGSLGADTPEALDLRTTLREFIDRNCSVAETARALHFHYNTLRYRIGKLESIVGPFMSDPHLRLDVALALRIIEMRGLARD
jgi:PucR family transcriptional regulator, purine catabolism regulatory protein